jgi:hypothetical protein
MLICFVKNMERIVVWLICFLYLDCYDGISFLFSVIDICCKIGSFPETLPTVCV